jgi:hypothetical protein
MYGGIRGKVEREKSTPLYFYLSEYDLPLNDEQREAGATKEPVWEIFKVNAEGGVATIRPLLCNGEPMLTVRTDAPFFAVFHRLCNFIGEVLRN